MFKLIRPTLRQGFLRNPYSLPTASCPIVHLSSLSLRKREQAKLSDQLRRDRDSNPGNAFGVYTLSRRASSTTRASLLPQKVVLSGRPQLGDFFKSTAKVQLFFGICKFYFYFFVLLRYFSRNKAFALAVVTSSTRSIGH